jgi:hypothetical protein
MRLSLRVGFVLLLLAGVLGISQIAFSQDVTAAIVGTVTDPSGAPISGASITVTDTERGTVLTARTTDVGSYTVLRVPIGTYTLKVSAPGFQTSSYPAFTLQLNQTARLNVEMKVGQISQTVEVTDSAPVLQSQTAEVGTVIDARTSDNLPLATRNYVQLTLLTPGAISVDPANMNMGSNTAEEGGRPYINGNREQSNNFLLDGVDNNQASDNILGYTPSPDAIEEFNLITQNASSEFGNYNGGIVNVTIKSGTNKFHGNLFEFFRNDMFNANKWENGLTSSRLPTPKLRWNMFGGTFGGPIIKNKLFFFGDYQGGRLDFPASAGTINVLTPAEIGGDFSAVDTQLYNPCAAGTGGTSGTACSILAPAARTPFAGNIIPSNMLNPAFTALVTNAAYPKSVLTLSNGFGQAVNTTAQQFNSDQGDIKVDYNVSDRDHLFVRYSTGKQNDPSTNSVLLLGSQVKDAYLHNGTVNWMHSFTPNLTNEARFGKNYVKLGTGLTTFDPSVGQLANTIGIIGGNPTGLDGLPQFGFGGGSITNVGNGTLQNLGAAAVVQKFSTTVTQFDDVLIYTHGRHTLKTGFQMNRYNINAFYSGNGGELGIVLFGNGPGGNYSGTETGGTPTGGDPAADWALGLPGLAGRGASSGGFHHRDWLFAGFAQDDWRITNTVTLNLGLRYEARTPWIESNDRQVNVNIQTGALEFVGNTPVPDGVVGTNGFSRGLYKSNYGLPDFQPRIGVAWSPQALGGKTVFRGAFTISSYLEGTGNNLRLTQNPPFTPPQVEANNVATGTGYSTESAFSSAAPPAGNPFVGATLFAWGGTVQPAVADQWNLSIQREVARQTTVQLAYLGQRTTHLMVPEWLAQGDLHTDGSITYPFIGGKNDPTSGLAGFGPNQLGNVKNTASAGNMNYNAMQAVLLKRFGNGLQGQVSYTFQKCMTNDDGYFGTWSAAKQATPSGNYWQNLYNPNGDYARCYWDSTHVLSAYAVYELPIGHGKRFGHDLPKAVNAAVGNWSISPIFTWHTGFPLSLYGADNSGTVSPENRPNCNGPVRYPKTVSDQGIQWFDPSSFSNAPPGTFGTCAAQGPVIGPGYVDADISLQKNFPITETMRLQFRADFLNAFNHPNFAAPNVDCCGSSGSFGISNVTQDARQLQFDLKFYF